MQMFNGGNVSRKRLRRIFSQYKPVNFSFIKFFNMSGYTPYIFNKKNVATKVKCGVETRKETIGAYSM